MIGTSMHCKCKSHPLTRSPRCIGVAIGTSNLQPPFHSLQCDRLRNPQWDLVSNKCWRLWGETPFFSVIFLSGVCWAVHNCHERKLNVGRGVKLNLCIELESGDHLWVCVLKLVVGPNITFSHIPTFGHYCSNLGLRGKLLSSACSKGNVGFSAIYVYLSKIPSEVNNTLKEINIDI